MAKFELKLPKMGESVAEATVTNWLKEVGDEIEEDEAILEIATDKVDSEIPSEVDGVLKEKLFEVDEVVQIGQTVAIIEVEKDEEDTSEEEGGDLSEEEHKKQPAEEHIAAVQDTVKEAKETANTDQQQDFTEA